MMERSNVYEITARSYYSHPFEGTKYEDTLYADAKNEHKHRMTCAKNRRNRKKRK